MNSSFKLWEFRQRHFFATGEQLDLVKLKQWRTIKKIIKTSLESCSDLKLGFIFEFLLLFVRIFKLSFKNTFIFYYFIWTSYRKMSNEEESKPRQRFGTSLSQETIDAFETRKADIERRYPRTYRIVWPNSDAFLPLELALTKSEKNFCLFYSRRYIWSNTFSTWEKEASSSSWARCDSRFDEYNCHSFPETFCLRLLARVCFVFISFQEYRFVQFSWSILDKITWS